MVKYTHTLNVHNLSCASRLSEIIFNEIKPNSIIDVGCGTGNFLKEFEKHGIDDFRGVDGYHLDLNSLYIDPKKVFQTDLEKPLDLNRKFDLVLCLEVAEHLSKDSANLFVESLTKHADTIVFSAAIPFQGGQNHINEQWQSYWINLFFHKGYQVNYSLREKIWNENEIFWWYKQNILVFKRQNNNDVTINKINAIDDVVHPQLFTKIASQLEDTLSGKGGILFSFKIFLNSIYQKFKKNH
jgi:SAM-dependent methyltransferase